MCDASSFDGDSRETVGTPRNIRTVHTLRLQQNMAEIRRHVPTGCRILAVVKADGYGHGAEAVSLAVLEGGADVLAVASVSEGVKLRKAGINAPMLVLGPVTQADVYDGVQAGLIQTVCSPEMVQLCEKAAGELETRAPVHLKVDSGMGRLGVRNEGERDAVLEALSRCPHVKLEGAFTHFADADGDADGEAYTLQQFRCFDALTKDLGVLRHCANSAAIHRWPFMALDMVRAGISLYGYPPVQTDWKLKPCMDWKAKVSFVKDIAPGTYLSYGRTFQAEKPLRVATVTCGYADGYHRAAGEKAQVLIRGRRAKVLGRICMDQMMVDVTDIPGVMPEDAVTLMGRDGEDQITAEEIAGWAGTICYEILLSVGSRVERIYEP